jgi:hypothetical protein
VTEGTGEKIRLLFTQCFSVQVGTWATASVLDFTNWTHLVIQYNGSTTTNIPKVFVNGTAVTLSGGGGASGTRVTDAGRALCFGNRSDGARPFRGQIDEIMFFTRTLSTDEIRQLYRMGATPRRIKE